MCVLEYSQKNVSKIELHSACAFHRRLKEALSKYNSHTVYLCRHIVGNQWLYANHYSSYWTKNRSWQGNWEEGQLGGHRGLVHVPEPCAALYLPVSSQKAAAYPPNAEAGLGQAQFPGKLSIAQKPQPKLHILLAFPKGSEVAGCMWSSVTSGSDQLHMAASLPDFLFSWMVQHGAQPGSPSLWAANNVIW